MNFWRKKNLRFEGVAEMMVWGTSWQIIAGEQVAALENLSVFDEAGDVAHFFLTTIWTNKTGAIMDLRISESANL